MVLHATSYPVPKNLGVDFQEIRCIGVGVGCSDSDGEVFGSGRWSNGMCDLCKVISGQDTSRGAKGGFPDFASLSNLV